MPGGGGGGGGIPERVKDEAELSKVSMSRTSMSSSSSRSEKSRSLMRRAAALGCSWSQASLELPGPSGVIWVVSRLAAYASVSMLLWCRM